LRDKRAVKNKLLILFLIVVLTGSARAASSSASYKITTGIFDAGAGAISSTSYHLSGKARERQIAVQSSSAFALNGGFLKSAYFGAVTPVLAPVVTSIVPNSALNTGTVNITNLGGANFAAGASVKLSKSGQPDINATNVAVVSAVKITCTLDLTGAAGGAWDVTVTNPDGRSGTLPSAFTVTFAAPTVSSITPKSGVNNAVISITNLAGTHFRAGVNVKLSKSGASDIIASNIVVVSSTQISCQFDLIGKTAGFWDVIVVNDDSQSGTLTQGFAVETPVIMVTKPIESSQPVFNPSTGSTTLSFSLGRATDDQGNPATIIIYVYNIRGERVYQTTFLAKVGDNSVVWDGLTAFKAYVSSGVYIVQVIAKTADGKTTKISEMKLIVTR